MNPAVTRQPAASPFAATAAATTKRGPALRRLARSGVAWGFLVSAATTVWILMFMGGWRYYRTPLAVRAYSESHAWLRPSGPIGQTLGVVGAALMLVPFLYMARKRIRAMRGTGTLGGWLELHLFCGVAGPILVTLHTSFKFNGIVSTAYWSMVLVMLSGFVGRYLYVRIPRSIRGAELTRAELDARAADLQDAIAGAVRSAPLAQRLDAFQRDVLPQHLTFIDLLFGERTLTRRLRGLEVELARAGLPEELRAEVLRLTAERALMMRRTAYLQRTRKLFDLWHVFHLPLVYLMLIIVVAHVGVALYLGYVPFRW
jgi:hypothetical protein